MSAIEDSKMQEMPKASAIPITEDVKQTAKIPKVIFIENTEAWVEKYTDDELFKQMNELY